jgi:hypothetical protein
MEDERHHYRGRRVATPLATIIAKNLNLMMGNTPFCAKLQWLTLAIVCLRSTYGFSAAALHM